MLNLIILITIFSLIASFWCSLVEAALYAVPIGFVKHLSNAKVKGADILLGHKENMGPPSAAILILNNLVNISSATILGGLVASQYGEREVVGFSMLFTLSLILFGEMLPKQIGYLYCRRVSIATASPVALLAKIFTPMLFFSKVIARLIGASGQQQVSADEVMSMADIGNAEGSIDHLEASVIKNIVGLDKVLVRDILTPRVVVSRVEETTKLSEVRALLPTWSHSRIPLFREDDPDHVTHYVMQRDVFLALLKGEDALTVRDKARELFVVPELTRVDSLLSQLVSRGEHIAAAVDEHGGFAGIITLEDIMEEIVGREIIDEYDLVEDMRKHAENLNRTKRLRRLRSK